MNFIAGSLLLLLNPENEKELQEIYIIDDQYEENIFWILVHIMKEKNWRVLFLDGTPGIYIMIKNLEKKMKEFIPEIYEHIFAIGVISFEKSKLCVVFEIIVFFGDTIAGLFLMFFSIFFHNYALQCSENSAKENSRLISLR